MFAATPTPRVEVAVGLRVARSHHGWERRARDHGDRDHEGRDRSDCDRNDHNHCDRDDRDLDRAARDGGDRDHAGPEPPRPLAQGLRLGRGRRAVADPA